jgi:hypothetical protein
MRHQNRDGQQLRGIFPKESRDDKNSSKNNPASSLDGAGQYYALGTKDEPIKRFELIQNASRYSLSYSLLPVSILENSSTLYLRAYELMVTIMGRNLDPIHEHFCNERILWVKASPSGKDDGTASTFVSEIRVEGDAVSTTI